MYFQPKNDVKNYYENQRGICYGIDADSVFSGDGKNKAYDK